MKTLKESLFDPDLVSRKLPYEKLLIGRISKNDILFFIEGYEDGDFMNIKNRTFHKWCSDFWNRETNSKNSEILRAGYYTWNPKNDISLEALDWLKPGKIHDEVHWNDVMYANSIDVFWGFWGDEKKWGNITEWILFTEKKMAGYETYILANRKEYDETDQQIIHKLIQTLSK